MTSGEPSAIGAGSEHNGTASGGRTAGGAPAESPIDAGNIGGLMMGGGGSSELLEFTGDATCAPQNELYSTRAWPNLAPIPETTGHACDHYAMASREQRN